MVQEGEQTEAFCDASCTRSHECGSPGSQATCESYCAPNLAWLDRYRPETMQIIVRCIVDIPCVSYFDEGSFTPCWEKAAREVEPTRRLRSFCRRFSQRWFECGASYDVDQCERDWSIYEGWFLDGLEACTANECSTFRGCIDAAGSVP